MARKPVIGLLGGGQLGRMLCEAAGPLGFEVAVLDTQDCPAKQIHHSPNHITGSFKDATKIRELAAKCDVLTVEIEHVETEILEEIATKGVPTADGSYRRVPVHPSWKTLRLIQDKYEQKAHFEKNGIAVAPQLSIEGGEMTLDSLRIAAEAFGFPFMLKAKKGSYDGRGNYKVSGPEDFAEAAKALGGLPLYAEKWQPFKAELSVLVIRTEDSEGNFKDTFAYDPVETVHEDSICSLVFMPPRTIDQDLQRQAQDLAKKTIAALWGRGVFAVEMFVLEDGRMVVNEVAPRPHNSGHHTIEAVPYMSQYKAQLYSILDMVPPSLLLRPRVSQAIMINILGGATSVSHLGLVGLTETFYHPDVDAHLHLYGKEAKPARKIGHVTVTTLVNDKRLEDVAAPLIQQAAQIRQHRLEVAAESQRPTQSSTAPTAQPTATPTSSRNTSAPLVVVTMGSDSDLPVLKAGLEMLEKFGVPYDYTITSAHRTPKRMVELGQSAAARGIKVLIAAAGGAAHLPGMLASETTVPVIGVPIKATHLDGQDSLLSIVQMPRGIPVATVGINNSTNAALLAIRILGSHFAEYREKLDRYMKSMEEEVIAKAEKLSTIGYKEYLA